jgi:DNA repair exonuclease SbcCD ATPase subunit
MKIDLIKLSLLNFKGIRAIEIDFSDETKIYGDNGTGKSTIFDAFTWLLFGKDAQDRKDFGVKTFDENGVIIPKIDHEVTAILLIDGVETKMTRVLKEKWVKKRGEETAEFSGNETLFFVNDVPYQSNEFTAYVNDICPEATFKLLTSPTYFNSLKWDVRRAMLTAIANVPSDEDIAGDSLASLLNTMRTEKKTLEDLKKEYAAKKKLLKTELEQKPIRIAEVTRNMPEAKDFSLIELEIGVLKGEIENMERNILDSGSGVQDAIRNRADLLIKKNNLESSINNLEYIAQRRFQESVNKKDSDIKDAKNKVLSLQQTILNHEADIKGAQGRIENLNAQNVELRNKWTTRNAETLVFDGSLSCPTCGQGLPDDFIEHQEAEATKKYNAAKALDLDSISHMGGSNNAEIEKSQEYIRVMKMKVEDCTGQIIKCESSIESIENTPSLHTIESELAGVPEYKEAQAELKAIIIPDAPQQPDTSELKQAKADYQAKLDAKRAELSTRDQITKDKSRIKELEAEEKTTAQMIAQLEKIEFQIDEFTKRKMNIVEMSVNDMFPSVKFRMFNTLINGGSEPACECLINGVPYSDANNAARINSGIEIINVFSHYHDFTAPIFIDNRESINTITDTDSQVVNLIVSYDQELKVGKLPLHQVTNA